MFGKKPPAGDMPPLPASDTQDVMHTIAEEPITASPTPVDPNNAKNTVDIVAQAAQAAEDTILSYIDKHLETPDFRTAYKVLIHNLVEKINFTKLQHLNDESKRSTILEAARELLSNIKIPLNSKQFELILEQALEEILGFGPIEPLLNDVDVNDIMINTCNQIYIEKAGKIYLTDITFIDEAHLISVIQRIVSRVGRRVDESNPMVDARMPDGSRFNAIIPPLALDGSLVSIRKFKKNKMPLSDYVDYNSLDEQMYKFLEICANCRLNIMISGGTGSGKTTLLNALSGHISPSERVITIEDAAELQLHQPHVLRLETRPASTEGTGEITQRHLVKNALRMRPDRIILGEIRGEEIIDLLSAMNTGHDGSMATIHSNNPRDCLARIENLVGMSSIDMSSTSLRYQISSALQMIVQISRMRDGKRRITHIEEIVGLEGSTITTQTLFSYRISGMDTEGNITGNFEFCGIRPKMAERTAYFGREKELLSILNLNRI